VRFAHPTFFAIFNACLRFQKYDQSMTPSIRSRDASDLRIRPMRPEEVSIAVDWAAREGWNPGLADDVCFAAADPQGFFIGELDGVPAATVSCVNYGADFAFLGFYIVREDLRGRGYGLRIWNAAIAHAGRRVIGLDGVTAQQQNYRKSGFEFAYANVRYGGIVTTLQAPHPDVVALSEIPPPDVEAYDATVFPAPRAAFLRAWMGASGHAGRALIRDGALAGWGVIRPCRKGYKIGPLAADDRAAAEAVLSALLPKAGSDEVFLDVPCINRDAVALARDLGLAPAFETARMYTGAIPPLRMERVFGVTSFELG
jgi:GNAT superfamily N-acetyltransferase